MRQVPALVLSFLFFFFFLMIRRRPRSTHFPYTTLFRSSLDRAPRPGCSRASRHPGAIRSEEHTSELQSRLHLVCRLLLEKKKNTKHKHETKPRTLASLASLLAVS